MKFKMKDGTVIAEITIGPTDYLVGFSGEVAEFDHEDVRALYRMNYVDRLDWIDGVFARLHPKGPAAKTPLEQQPMENPK